MSHQSLPGTWIQLDQREATKLGKLIADNPMAGAVMATIMGQIDGENAIVMSHALIAAMLGISKSSVVRAMKELVKGQWIKVIQLGAAGTTNAYLVNSEVAWQGPRIGMRTAKFKATVIAFEPEQRGNITQKDLLLEPVQTDLEDAEFCGGAKAK